MSDPRKPQLFLDCDGVLADFDLYAEKLFGLPPRKAEAEFGTKRFWADLRTHEGFYRALPLMEDARELFDAVAHLNPIILTGAPLGGWAEPQKLAWAAEHFPGTQMIVCLSREKRLHMKAGDILVDDYLKYRHLWEEAGGIFVHHTSAASSIAALRRLGVLEDRSEDDLLTKFPPGLDHPPGTPCNIEEPFFACPVGEQLWHEYRAVHPEAPERPPACPEDDPGAEGASKPYYDHAGDCGNCNEA